MKIENLDSQQNLLISLEEQPMTLRIGDDLNHDVSNCINPETDHETVSLGALSEARDTCVSFTDRMVLKRLKPGRIELRRQDEKDVTERTTTSNEKEREGADVNARLGLKLRFHIFMEKTRNKLHWRMHRSLNTRTTSGNTVKLWSLWMRPSYMAAKKACDTRGSCNTSSLILSTNSTTTNIRNHNRASATSLFDPFDSMLLCSVDFDDLDTMLFSPYNHRPSLGHLPSIDLDTSSVNGNNGNNVLDLANSSVSELIALSFRSAGTPTSATLCAHKYPGPVLKSILKKRSPHVNFASPLILPSS